MNSRVVINRGDVDIRVAILEDDKLVEYHKENLSDKSIVGNIYRGVVQDVVPGLQAAFIDIGLERNVFLHFLDIQPESLVMTEKNLEAAMLEASKTVLPGRIVKKGRRDRTDLSQGNFQAPIKKGDTIIVQVVKDGISDKAPRVSANLAIAGRYMVLLPFPGQDGGVSKKIAMGKERHNLKKLLRDLNSEMHSFIIRTAGLGAEEEQVREDARRLKATWDDLVKVFQSTKRTGLVYSDHNIMDRLVRDVFSDHLDKIICDDSQMVRELESSLSAYMPKLAKNIELHDRVDPIFEAYGIKNQLELAMDKKVWLKSGGYLIIEETEALTAIDVNTGRFTGGGEQERTSFVTNMEACEAIARQVRLRDIGGIIVVDFIDMLKNSNKKRVTDEFTTHMERDRAKTQIGSIGDFGLLMMTRKRKHKSLVKQVFEPCPYCDGDGRILRREELWRRMKADLLLLCHETPNYGAVVVTCEPTMSEFLKKDFRTYVRDLADVLGVDILIRDDRAIHRDDFTLTGITRPEAEGFVLPNARLRENEVFRESIAYDDVAAQELVESLVSDENETDDTEDKDQQASDQDENGKRTRRGRRGGRKRRGRGDDKPEEEVSVQQELQETLEEAESDSEVEIVDIRPEPAKTPQVQENRPHSKAPAATNSPSPSQSNATLSGYEFKSKLQIVSSSGKMSITPPKKGAETSAAIGEAVKKSNSADVSNLKAVQIMGSVGSAISVAPSQNATTKTEPPKPLSDEKEPFVPHVPGRNLQIVAQWGTKSAPKAVQEKTVDKAGKPEPVQAKESAKPVAKKASKKSAAKPAAKKATTKKAAKKASAKKATPAKDKETETKKPAAKKATAKKAAKKSTATKPAAKKSAKKASNKATAKKAAKKSSK